jgi:soluble cytochrome b562
MTLPSDRPLKTCNFCGKQVKNLGFHIANQHPKIMEQIDEMQETLPGTPPGAAPGQDLQALRKVLPDINSMIREKLDTMLNIKIIEMLSKSPNTSIQEIQSAINPAPKTTIQDFKEMRDLFKESAIDKISDIDTGNQWANVALQALPIVREMLPKKQNEVKQNVREGNTRSEGSLKPIQLEIAGSAREPSGDSQKSRVVSTPEQQDNRGINPAG